MRKNIFSEKKTFFREQKQPLLLLLKFVCQKSVREVLDEEKGTFMYKKKQIIKKIIYKINIIDGLSSERI